ncbi:MAG: 16S rRNA (guanine(527)-N(7))-methyltransferase RsmG [Sphingomonadales bacterium]|nr:16S rRNA (guanine(527)-N(7))-methyltransferase RsmG [Sphingomonadales bacterium]
MITTEVEARNWIATLPQWNETARERLDTLIALLREENTRQNLVAVASLDHVWQRHIADSAQLLPYVPRETPGTWLDLGTGAGFPGLVIAALCPEREVVMVESRARRIDWLERARAALGLDRARIEGARLELVESFPAAVISARAFAPLVKLVPLSARFSTSDTIWLLPKGQSARDELASLRGWQHLFHVEQSLTDPDAGVIVGTLKRKAGKRT